MAHVSFYDALGLISYADGYRLINQWWLDQNPKNSLRVAVSSCVVNVSIAGLFSAHGPANQT